jgi:hypothetical protein
MNNETDDRKVVHLLQRDEDIEGYDVNMTDRQDR